MRSASMKRSMKRLRLRLRDQMQDHLGVGGRLHHGAVADEFAAQRQAVGEVAVVGDGEAAGVEFGEQRLHVAQDGAAGGGIADMADGGVAGQALDHFAAGEGVADEAEPAFGVEAAAVEGDDAGGFLAAMLEGVQAERGDGGGLGMAEDAEHAAFLAQRVAFEIVLQIDRTGVSVRLRGVDREWVLHRVHRASLVWRRSHVPAGLPSISCLRPSRAGFAVAIAGRGLPARRQSARRRGLFFLNLFKMVFSGSSGKSDISQSPVPCSTIRDLALVTQSGRCLSGTSQVKNRKATTTISRPRASPNRKPRVRSSAPIREFEDHVGDPHRDDRDHDQGDDEDAGDDDDGRDRVVVEIGFGGRQQLWSRHTAWPAPPRPRRRSTGFRA